MDPPRGRGASDNPLNRFETLHLHIDPDASVDDHPSPLRTRYLNDDSQSILQPNSAEDLSFEYSLNPYRGCEHGCSYCYARTYHEYLGYSAGLDFESVILVKTRAPQLLEQALAKPSFQPGRLAMSGVTDCYQPVEKHLQLTRRCLEVLARFRHPVALITKNALVTRDLDHLRELARHQAVAVYLSITTLDPKLARILEPRASSPRTRLDAIRQLAEAGIPVGPSAAPMIPGLNDHELPAILEASREAGATFATFSTVRLPGNVAHVFSSWLDRHFPGSARKILDRIRATHDGHLNSNTPGLRMRGSNLASQQLRNLFHASCRRLQLSTQPPPLSSSSFLRQLPNQPELPGLNL